MPKISKRVIDSGKAVDVDVGNHTNTLNSPYIYLPSVFVYSCMCTHVEIKEQLGWAPYTMGSRDRTQVVRLAASTFSC